MRKYLFLLGCILFLSGCANTTTDAYKIDLVDTSWANTELTLSFASGTFTLASENNQITVFDAEKSGNNGITISAGGSVTGTWTSSVDYRTNYLTLVFTTSSLTKYFYISLEYNSDGDEEILIASNNTGASASETRTTELLLGKQ